MFHKMETICRPFPAVNFRFPRISVHQPVSVRFNPVQNPNLGEAADKKMFFLGMGFLGRFYAGKLKINGWMVSGSCTSVQKKNKLEEMGYAAYVFDESLPPSEILGIMNEYTHLVISIPPVAGLGDPVLSDKDLAEKVLQNGRLQWLGYISTTSVYGDSGGVLVDEDYPVKPSSDKIRDRLCAEKDWLSLGHNLGITAHVFRVGGIYGPGRSAIDTILKQQPLSRAQKSRSLKKYTSRVHVADICQALNASIMSPSSGKTYNIVDDDPAPRMDVFQFAESLVHQKLMRHGKTYDPLEKELESNERVSIGEKRVSNARMKEELGVKLIHPSYRSGLHSIIERMNDSHLESRRS